jgi:Type II restriction endonuclease EcoO109I
VDLEFVNDGVHYLVSIKSGPNWGNSSQQRKQADDLQTAMRVLKQSNHTTNVQPVLGICYGKTRRSFLRGYMKVVGQDFWYLISSDKNLYTNIIEPLGYRAKEHNESFAGNKAAVINKFTGEFMKEFCDSDGKIDWKKLVVFNSGNLME